MLDLDDATRDASPDLRDLRSRATEVEDHAGDLFGGLGDNLDTALSFPVAGLHIDLVRAPGQLDNVLAWAPQGLVYRLASSTGATSGAQICRSAARSPRAGSFAKGGTDHVQIAPSCSLLHVPIDLEQETDLDPNLKTWLAFSVQKMEELSALGKALVNGREAVIQQIADSAVAAGNRQTFPKVHDAAVAARLATITPDMTRRGSSFDVRRRVQQQALNLPSFPTTTIVSFPQTDEVRKARAAHAKGTLSDADYAAFLVRDWRPCAGGGGMNACPW